MFEDTKHCGPKGEKSPSILFLSLLALDVKHDHKALNQSMDHTEQ